MPKAKGQCAKCGRPYLSEAYRAVAVDQDGRSDRIIDFTDQKDAESHLDAVSKGRELCPTCWIDGVMKAREKAREEEEGKAHARD